MIKKEFVDTLAHYNQWKNALLIEAAEKLTDEQRQQDVGAFFGSIQRTLSHLLWGDTNWLNRLTQTPYKIEPIDGSAAAYPDWLPYKVARRALDARLISWAQTVTDDWLMGDLTYRTSAGIELVKPISWLVVHMFNHQTHHLGQVHTLITQFGIDIPATDLVFLPQFNR